MTLSLPLFIVFEGIDGCGKSTLAALLADHWSSQGIPVYRGTEPTEGAWGRRIREMLRSGELPDPEAQMSLFLNDREEDVRRNITPALEQGKLIILDRYYFSNAAYQGSENLPPSRIVEENLARGFPVPHRVYLVDLDPAKALRRIEERNSGGKKEAFEKTGALQRVREAYLSLRDDTFFLIDSRDKPAILLKQILKDMEQNFSLR